MLFQTPIPQCFPYLDQAAQSLFNLVSDFLHEIVQTIELAMSARLGVLCGVDFDALGAHGQEALGGPAEVDDREGRMKCAVLPRIHLNKFLDFHVIWIHQDPGPSWHQMVSDLWAFQWSEIHFLTWDSS